jgi:hypothetical protein
MSNAAVVIPFHAPQSTNTIEALTARFLRAKRATAEAEAILEALGPQLIAALREEAEKGCAVPGLGAVTAFEATPQKRLDQKAAVKLLEDNKIPVPRTPSGGGWQLRATLV